MKATRSQWAGAILVLVVLGGCSSDRRAGDDSATKRLEGKHVITLTTSMGDIKLELDADKAPVTVENFLAYVDDGFFDGTIFHRVIPAFMIQGGGFTEDMKQKSTRASIENEARNGLTNERGTIAMARTQAVDSATAQFFINLKSNEFLNHGGRDFGYAVFGHVVEGLDVIDEIGSVPTGTRKGQGDVPIEPVLIQTAQRE